MPESNEQLLHTMKKMLLFPKYTKISGNIKRKDFVFVSTEHKGLPFLFHYSSEKGKELISDEMPISGPCALHPEKNMIVFLCDKDANEDYFLYVLDFSHKPIVKQVVKEPLGNINYLFWLDDESFLVIGFNQESYFIQIIGMSGSIETIYTTDLQILGASFYREGKIIAITQDRINSKIVLINIESKEIVEIISKEDGACKFPVFNENGNLAFITDKQKTNDELIIKSLKDSKKEFRTAVPGFVGTWLFDTSAMVWTKEGNLLVKIASNAQAIPRLFDTSTNKWLQKLIDGTSGSMTSTSEGPIFIASNYTQPPTVYKYQNNNLKELFTSGEPLQGIDYENHLFNSVDGKQIQAWYVKKKDNQKDAIYIHGGPNYAEFNSWNPYLLAFVLSGMNIFAINYRGSTTFGQEFQNCLYGDMGGKEVQDIVYGARYLQSITHNLEKPRIFGESYGGYLTLMAIGLYPEYWHKAVSYVPLVDMVEAYETGNSHYRQLFSLLMGGTPSEKPIFYSERSPITYVERVSTPTKIFHGVNDPRCPIKPVKEYYQKAQQLNVPVELEILHEEGHGTIVEEKIIRSYLEGIKFLE
ncbi:MAG: prolyl oligopeptidase family serine peptidase [Candidatus Thorarchaeota archaeon]